MAFPSLKCDLSICLNLAKFKSGVDSKYDPKGIPGHIARITLSMTSLSSYPLSKPASICLTRLIKESLFSSPSTPIWPSILNSHRKIMFTSTTGTFLPSVSFVLPSEFSATSARGGGLSAKKFCRPHIFSLHFGGFAALDSIRHFVSHEL